MYALFLASVFTSLPLANAAPVQVTFENTTDYDCLGESPGPRILDEGDHLVVHANGILTAYGPYGDTLLSMEDEGLRWTYSGRFLLGVRMMGNDIPVMQAAIVDTTTGERKDWDLDFGAMLEGADIATMGIQGAPRSLEEADFLFSYLAGASEDKEVSQLHFSTLNGDVIHSRVYDMPLKVARLNSQDGLTVTAAEEEHYSIIQGEVAQKVPLPDKAEGKKNAFVSPAYRYDDDRWLVVITTKSNLWIDELERTPEGWKVISRAALNTLSLNLGLEIMAATPSAGGIGLWLANPVSRETVFHDGHFKDLYLLNQTARPALYHESTVSIPPHSSPYRQEAPSSRTRAIRSSILLHYTSGGTITLLNETKAHFTYSNGPGRGVGQGCWAWPMYQTFDPFMLRGTADSLSFTSLLKDGKKSQMYAQYQLVDGQWKAGKPSYKHWKEPTPWPSFNVGRGLWVTSSLQRFDGSEEILSIQVGKKQLETVATSFRVTLTFPEPPEDAPETVAEKE